MPLSFPRIEMPPWDEKRGLHLPVVYCMSVCGCERPTAVTVRVSVCDTPLALHSAAPTARQPTISQTFSRPPYQTLSLFWALQAPS